MNTVTHLSKCLQLIVNGAEVLNGIDHLLESREFDELKVCSLATRTTLLFLSIAEIAFAVSNESRSSSAVKTKSLETFIRFLDTPLQTIEAFSVFFDPQCSSLEKMCAIEKKLLGSCVGLIRSCTERDHLLQLHFRDLSPKEQAQLKFPIYESVGDDHKIVGYFPFDLKKCQESIARCESALPKLNICEAALHVGCMTKVIGISVEAFRLLTQRTMVRALPLQNLQGIGGGGRLVAESSEREEVNGLCNLRRFNFIPIELEEDPTLKQFICMITCRPIRHIVMDPTTGNRTFYEKAAIERWLDDHETSPATRQLLFRSQLTSSLGLQMIIDERLDLYSQRLRSEINQIFLEPINQVEIDDAVAAVIEEI